MAPKQDKKNATPLVLPNNCIWDEKTGITLLDVERETLTVVPQALDQLREIKDRVCVVSIAGPCRKGKSYILSKAFDQGEVFPLGHSLNPETMGIWLWVVPEKFKDSTGREFTVVLMDSEGIDAVSSKQSDDHKIFTLSVLLSSIMIYNSSGVPNRSDLEGLDFIGELSKRIQLHANTDKPSDDQRFYEAFPFFIWLLRDAALDLPVGYKTIKEYFLKHVFDCKGEGNTEKARKTAERILTYFSGFDAFSLPPPAYDKKVLKSLNDNTVKSKVNPEFLKEAEENLKDFLRLKLTPKKSINQGEFVTGEALAALVSLFVDTLNTPGAVPNVQNAWDTFVQTKCSEVLADAVKVYEQEMTSFVEKEIPCEADLLRSAHDKVMKKCLKMFHDETFSFSTKSVGKYLKTLTDKTNFTFSSWLEKNNRETETFCTQLIKELKRTILDPVLARLRSQEGSKMQFSDNVAAYNEIQQKYSSNARGAKDIQESVFMNFHPELQKEMEQNMHFLQQMKEYDESLAKEKAAKAALEERRQKIEATSAMANNQDKLATPLVLPNNCNWDEKTGKYTTKPNVKRETLTVVPKALDQLREIKGHVCVVSIAGPYRKGKSYILSKVFEQGKVFPLGHLMEPETMGIWLWVVPEKFKDSTGREFTVVLMDSEGIDAVSSEDSDDHKIFTLSVLLSSIMIYNSTGVPNRSDLDGLDFIVKLSQRIQLQTDQSTTDEQQFSEAFPYFIWLLRDVQLSLPEECKTLKDYFLKRVLKCGAKGDTEKANKTAESILKYFSGFDACSLPPPTDNDKVIKNLDDEKFKSKINAKFLKQVDVFKAVLRSKLSPKKSINKGEFVTGEALAALIELFVEALNTPGAVPNVQNAWDTFVQTKCSEVLADALKAYEQEIRSLVEMKIPCEADVLWSAHDKVMEKCLEMFHNETFSLSIKSVDKYLKELTGKTDILLFGWLKTNKQRTKESCKALIKELEKTILDPVLSRLVGPDGSQMDFNELVEAYKLIEQRYKDEGRGDLETKALAFVDINSRLNDEMTRNWAILEKLKNYDALLAKEKTQKGKMEQEKERAKEEMKRLEKEQRDRQKEQNMFYKKQEEDKIRMQEMYTKSLEDQREQMRNMIEANLEVQKKEREDALAHQKTIMDDYVKTLEKKFEQSDQEMKHLREQMLAKEAKAKEDQDNMSRMYREEMAKDRKAAEKNLEDAIKRINAENKAVHEAMRKQMEELMRIREQIVDSAKNASWWQRTKYWATGNPDHLDLK